MTVAVESRAVESRRVVQGAGRPGGQDSAQLIEGLRQGDRVAVETLFREQGPLLMSIARSIVGDEPTAHDAVQEGVVSALKSINSLRSPDCFPAWLKKTVTNAALAHLRKKGRRRERSIEELLPHFHDDGHRNTDRASWATNAPDPEREETRDMVRSAINELPEPYRGVIMLRDILGMGTEETSRVLGISCTNAKVRLHRARQALRTLLEERMAGD